MPNILELQVFTALVWPPEHRKISRPHNRLLGVDYISVRLFKSYLFDSWKLKAGTAGLIIITLGPPLVFEICY